MTQPRKPLPAGRRKSIVQSYERLIKTSFLTAGTLPLVIQPDQDNLILSDWVRSNRAFIEAHLQRHGGLLFRGFGLTSQSDFEDLLEALALPLMRYFEGATPRTELGDHIYTSTEFPADQSIALHNELTYVTTWPMKILFFCQQPAASGGATPIADVRKVLRRLSPAVVGRFLEHGWMLVRNFGDLGLSWQTSFHTQASGEVEAYCRQARIEWEWRSGSRLRTKQARRAIAMHPRTGEEVWFNHVAFWHVSSLVEAAREAMRDFFSEEELPYNTYYGDGSPIEDEVVEEIREAYRKERVEFGWERGDLLLLDNMLVAHGRNPFAGERQILVAMGEPYGVG